MCFSKQKVFFQTHKKAILNFSLRNSRISLHLMHLLYSSCPFSHFKVNVCLQCSFKKFHSVIAILFSCHGCVLCIKVDNNCQNSSHACAFLKGNEIKGNGNDIIIMVRIYRYFQFCHFVHKSKLPWIPKISFCPTHQ